MHNDLLQLIPSVDSILQSDAAKAICPESGDKHLADLVRLSIETIRENLLRSVEDGEQTIEKATHTRESFLEAAECILLEKWTQENRLKLAGVINATGVIIHTNLGRAPISDAAKKAILDTASYCNLEFDLESGKRGKRGHYAEKLLAELTGSESALIVNNCAAAAVLVLSALSKGGEAIVSRGELVEIGGDFRVPDLMAQSDTKLIEVGTTNRTKLADYESAITGETRMLVKIHPSNYRIVGFTETPTVGELANLAAKYEIPFYEDAGSGVLRNLSSFGLTGEPIISDSIKAGADVVTFSGDKLLGSVQAGLIVGRTSVIEKLRKHSLYRALRASKLVYAALEATLLEFRKDKIFENIPILTMLSLAEDELRIQSQDFANEVRDSLGNGSRLKIDVVDGESVVGGGSAPSHKLKTSLVLISSDIASARKIEELLRDSSPPIIARVIEDRVALDLRTVAAPEKARVLRTIIKLNNAIAGLASQKS